MRLFKPAAAVLLIALGGAALAQTTPAKVIETREANFKAMGKAMKTMADQYKSGKPDLATIQKSAAVLAGFAPQIPSWFPAGTGPEAGKTEALPAIWAKPAEFKAAAAKFNTEATKLKALADAGDLAGAGAQLKAVGGTCGACHDNFRKKDS